MLFVLTFRCVLYHQAKEDITEEEEERKLKKLTRFKRVVGVCAIKLT